MKKVLIALSGGVDSSVAALLTKNAGYECIGCTMVLYTGCEYAAAETERNVSDAKKVCDKLGIPFYVFDLQNEFEKRVIDSFADAYSKGLTPNPCITCNKYLKFGALLEKADELGCDFVATGHYAKTESENGRYVLKRGADLSKDQSYVLYSLGEKTLGRVLLPLGNYSKEEIRRMARENGFDNAERPDSQDICFVPDGDYAAFIENRLGKKFPCGDFVYNDGRILGKHKGIIHYTVGQRKGLGLALPAPAYVIKKDVESNEVVLGADEDLFSREMLIYGFNTVSCDKWDGKIRVLAKARYRHTPAPAEAEMLSDGTVKVVFDEPQRALTPGQSAVLYSGETVLGGGIIR